MIIKLVSYGVSESCCYTYYNHSLPASAFHPLNIEVA